MKTLRQALLISCFLVAFTALALQPDDAVITSISNAYSQAKEAIKSGKNQGNEMVTTFNYTVRGEGKTTETLHFFYPLYFITRSYNIGKRKYYEEFLFDTDTDQLIFAFMQDYDQNGKKIDRRFYFKDGSVYDTLGPAPSPYMAEQVMQQATELKLAFNNISRNPKE